MNANNNTKIEEEQDSHEYQVLSLPYSKGQTNIYSHEYPIGALFFKNGAPKDFGFEFVPEGISPRNFRKDETLLESNREKLLKILKEEFTKYKIAFEDINQRWWELSQKGRSYLSFQQTINLDPKQKSKNIRGVGPSVRITFNAVPNQILTYLPKWKDETSVVNFFNVSEEAMDKITFVLDKAFIKYLAPEPAPVQSLKRLRNNNNSNNNINMNNKTNNRNNNKNQATKRARVVSNVPTTMKRSRNNENKMKLMNNSNNNLGDIVSSMKRIRVKGGARKTRKNRK